MTKQQTIGVETAAALIRVSPRRLQQLSNEGWIKKEGRGQYTVRGVVQGFITYLDDQLERTERRNADNRVREARAREIELRTARAEAQLVPTDEVLAWTQAVVGALMERLRELPERLTTDARERERIAGLIDQIGRDADEAGAEFRAALGR